MNKQTIEDMYEIAKQRNGKCLSKEYANAKTKLKWQCDNGHIWKATSENIKKGCWCPICSHKKLTIEEMHEIAKQRNGKCISKEYVNSYSILEWQCDNGHIWKATANNIKNGTWCPYCAGKK